MIFVTVGSQMPFDRLIRAVDDWVVEHGGRDLNVLAQIGSGSYIPKSFDCFGNTSPAKYREYCRGADVIVSHAGMGTILTAMEFGRRLVLLPRRGDLRETRNDHQLAAAKWLAGRQGISVVMDEHLVGSAISRSLGSATCQDRVSSVAPEALCDALRRFICKV